MTLTLPIKLQYSYLKSRDYPENLIPGGTATYRSKLASYKKRLDDAESSLCLIEGKDVDEDFEIPIIDFEDGKARQKRKIHSPVKLTDWLGVGILPATNNSSTHQVVTQKSDPKCRFIYLHGEHSRDKLRTTRDSLCQIMSYHQVMPAYLDHILVFGEQSDPKDLRFSGFRVQIRFKAPGNQHIMPEIRRSGKLFQLCYNLKGVQLKLKSNENIKLDEWSIRDAAFYHQFDVEYGNALWITTKGGRDLLERYEELIGPSGRPEDKSFCDPESCFRSTFATHLLYCHWSTEDWRWYICWLEKVVDQESRMAVEGFRGPGYAHKEYGSWDIQDLQHWQDKTNEAVMVLEANAKILKSLRKFYSDLTVRSGFPDTLRNSCEDDLHTFLYQLNEISNDFDMQIARAKLLVNIIHDRKELVVQHLQSQASERTEQLNKNLEREAIVMRVITIVTLLYLPATFVSTFFSTDVIKYQDQNQDSANYENGAFSSLALKRWLQVTISLTTVTVLGVWLTYRIYDTSTGYSSSSERLKHTPFASESSLSNPYTQMLNEEGYTITRGSVRQAITQLFNTVSSMKWSRDGGAVLPLNESGTIKTG